MQPWTEKYRPKSIEEVQGHPSAAKRVLEFVKHYDTQKKKALLLHGTAGVGKTSLAVAVASQMGYELVEVNASDVRNASSIREVLGPALEQRSLFNTGKLILFDEVDGLSGRKDRGGASELAKLIKTSAHPIILTANDAWDKKLKSLRRHCELIELKNPSYKSVLAVLQRVADAEGVKADEKALTALARRSGGDLRGALTDLQTLGASGSISHSDLEELGDRRKAESMFQAMQRILKGTDMQLARDAIDVVDENIDETLLWIDENLPREYTEPADLIRGYDMLSRADVFKGRIMRWQHWRFLVYVIDFMTMGVASAKEERYKGFTKYSRPQRLLKYWRANRANSKRDAIAEKLAEATHTSKNVALQDSLPYLKAILAQQAVADELELTNEEVDWLKG